jgi:magnesium transporter
MLVNCVVYKEGRKVADIDRREISEYLRQPGVFVWVAMKDPSDEEVLEMQEEFDLHELAAEDARHGHQRPKIEEYGSSLFVVLNTIELTPTDELKIGEVDIFVGPNYILSIRHRTERGFQDVRARAEREPELLSVGSGFVLYALMDTIVDRYFPVLDAIEGDLEHAEDQLFARGGSPRATVEQLYYVKRELMQLKHIVGPALETSNKLFGGRVPQVCAGLGDYFRDVYDHLLRLNQQIDTLRDTVNTAIQAALAMISLDDFQVTKRLAAYAALVAVPTMIAGVYGMNFQHMPELQWSFGYPLAIGVMVAIDGVLFYRFRKAGWL